MLTLERTCSGVSYPVFGQDDYRHAPCDLQLMGSALCERYRAKVLRTTLGMGEAGAWIWVHGCLRISMFSSEMDGHSTPFIRSFVAIIRNHI
jgi:hypothetical protein